MADRSEWFDPQPQTSPVSVNSVANTVDAPGKRSMQGQPLSSPAVDQYAFFYTVRFKFCFLAMWCAPASFVLVQPR